MTLAVIADVHANYLALEAALAAARQGRADGIIFLGDYVSDCPCPERTMTQLYAAQAEFRCWFVRGNREDYLLAHRQNPNDGWRDSSSTGSLLYTYAHLDTQALDFFAAMPICLDIAIPGAPVITACHGSPERTKEWLPGKTDLLDRYTRVVSGEILLCGHTHRAEYVRINGKTVLFCPSAGLPAATGRQPQMMWLTLCDGRWIESRMPLHFDLTRLLAAFGESGLAQRAMIWSACIMKGLRDRREYAAACAALAWQMAAADGFRGGTVLPEIYWQRAARRLSIIE